MEKVQNKFILYKNKYVLWKTVLYVAAVCTVDETLTIKAC